MRAILTRYTLFMSLLITGFIGLSVVLLPSLVLMIRQNGPLNLTIIILMLVGVVWVFSHMRGLKRELAWMEAAEKGRTDHVKIVPKVLRPLANLLNEPTYTGLLTPMSARSLLVSIEERLDATRDVPRYLAGLLIFLGLLGTFWGLSQTIGSIAGLIQTLDIDNAQAFSSIKEGLQGPLAGMGTAFSCSMLGLAGSLLLGCLDLQYGKALGAFYHYVEEKVSMATRVGLRDEASHSGAAYSHSLLEQVVELTHRLHQQIKGGEEDRSNLTKSLTHLTDHLEGMSSNVQTHQDIMRKIAQNHLDLQTHLMQIVQQNSHQEHTQALQKMMGQWEIMCTKILQEMSEGREKLSREMASEIRLVSRTLSSLANSAA